MSNKNLLFFIVTTLYAIPTVSMDLALKNEYVTKRHYITNEGDIPGEYVKILSDRNLNKKAINAFVLTNPRVIAAIKTTPGEIVGRIGQHYSNKCNNVLGITKNPQEHGKSIVGLANSPSKKINGASTCIIGSANPTNSIYKYGNFESIVVSENDTDLANQLYKAMTSESPIKEKKAIILTTPEKNTVYSSKKFNLNKSRAERIKNIANREGKNGKIWANSMSFNDEELADAFIEAAQKGVDTQLLLDRASMSNLYLLNKMHKGKVDMRIYDPAGNNRRLNHKKTFLSNSFLEMSTGNFTEEGNNQENISTYFFNDEQLFADARTDHKRVRELSTPYEQAVPLYKEAEKNKKIIRGIKRQKTKK